MKKNKFFILFLSIAIFLVALFIYRDFYHDDAYISLRYARNFLRGWGLVWNHGEKVEGYTNFFWIIIISFLSLLKVDLILASRILGSIFSIALISLLVFFSGKKNPISPFFLVTNGCFALWTLGGLETTTFSFFLTLATLLYMNKSANAKSAFISGLILAFAALTRPEGLLFFFLFLMYMIYEGITEKKSCKVLILNFFLGFMAIYLPYFIWRISYYHFLFPNTLYAKGGINFFKFFSGMQYSLGFLLHFGFPCLIFLFAFRDGWQKDRKEILFFLFLITPYFFYVTLMGGDHMPGYRFFVPILPLFYLLIENVLSHISEFRSRSFASLFVLLFLLINCLASYRYVPREKDPAALAGQTVGIYIREHWPPHTIIASNNAGSLPYFSDRYSIDMLGLTDSVIAHRKIPQYELHWQFIAGHEKGDGKYVLSRKPEYIILGPADGRKDEPWFLSDKEILEDPRFKKEYLYHEVQIKIEDEKVKRYKYNWLKNGILTFRYYHRQYE